MIVVLLLAVVALAAAAYSVVQGILAGTPWHLTGAGPTMILAMAVVVLVLGDDES